MTLARADPHLAGTGFDLPPVGNSSLASDFPTASTFGPVTFFDDPLPNACDHHGTDDEGLSVNQCISRGTL
jgi:hypothetical protein